MKSAINTKRKTDALIAIEQNNLAKRITITNVNKAAEILTGYSASEVIGKDFSDIIAPRVNELLNGYIEFDHEDSDFAMVARKIPNFQIQSRKGEIFPVSLKIFNLVRTGADTQEYELLMRDVTLIKNIAELKEKVKNSESAIETKDPQTGLPTIDSIVYAIDLSYYFMEQHHAIEACFVLVEVGNIGYYKQTYGEYVAYDTIGMLGGMIKKCCREEDVVSYMGDGVIGLVLIDCNAQDAKIVLKRILSRVSSSKITMQNGKPINLALAVSFTQMRQDREVADMINACENGLNKLASERGEGLIQV
jgi:PAS domain S-box-containing protein